MVQHYISTIELAKILGISRIAVFKKIKLGQIPAKKQGRNFVIDKRDIPAISGAVLSVRARKEIDAAVQKTIKEYGETLRLLGKE